MDSRTGEKGTYEEGQTVQEAEEGAGEMDLGGIGR